MTTITNTRCCLAGCPNPAVDSEIINGLKFGFCADHLAAVRAAAERDDPVARAMNAARGVDPDQAPRVVTAD